MLSEYQAATQNVGWIDLSDHCLIEIQGVEARQFLNGILTNAIKTLLHGKGCYTCLCTPKGKILADLFCYATDTQFKLECYQNLKDKILELLRRYIIIQKVHLQDMSQEWGGVGVLGLKSPSFVQKHFPSFSHTSHLGHSWISNVWVIYKPQWGYSCFEFWMKKDLLSSFREKMSLPLISKEDQEVLRVESKTPLYGVDMSENTIPQEANLHEALNFKKGCYIGQETIARLQNLGHVNKQLVLLKIDGNEEVPKESKIVTLQGEEIGHVTSQCLSDKYKSRIALGYIKYAYLKVPCPFYIDQRPCWIMD